ncbi:MAG: GreA/GreB family elongation factor [Actinomycetales bacterium]
MSVLTTQAQSRLAEELEDLRDRQRPELLRLAAGVDGRDPADQADRAQREIDLVKIDRRIQRLEALLADGHTSSSSAGAGAPGTAQLGSTVDLDFGDGQPQRVILGDVALSLSDIPVVTVESPLGRALLGSSAGDTVTYRVPAKERTATVVAVYDAGQQGDAR